MKNLQTVILPVMVGFIVLSGFAGSASAETSTSTTVGTTTISHRNDRDGLMRTMSRLGVRGTVSAISGTTITVVSGKASSTITYTVDATGATFKKNTGTGTPAAALITDVAVGDAVSVIGTVTGINVVATTVIDGAMKFKMAHKVTKAKVTPKAKVKHAVKKLHKVTKKLKTNKTKVKTENTASSTVAH